MIKIYRDGNQIKRIDKDITLAEMVESDEKDFDLIPGTRLVLEQKTRSFDHDGSEEEIRQYSFWIGDATPYHAPSDSDAEEGWFEYDYLEWNVVEIRRHTG